jgi:hypothetical protein
MDYRLADEPVAVLNAAIQELVGQQQAKAAAPAAQQQQQPAAVEVPHFLPAQRFLGAKAGYYFGTAEEGTGCVVVLSCLSCSTAPLDSPRPVVLLCSHAAAAQLAAGAAAAAK